MASSRWKRFAFFDRQTLTIPTDVLEDLIPLGGGNRSGSSSTGGTAAATGTTSSTTTRAAPSDDATTAAAAANRTMTAPQTTASTATATSTTTTLTATISSNNDELLTLDERVSMVVTTAALPWTTKPVAATTTTTAAAAGVVGTDLTTTSTATTRTATSDSALRGMWSSLTACTPTSIEPSTTEIVVLPSQCQATSNNNNSNSNTIAASRNELDADDLTTTTTATGMADGLVLAFVASRDSPLVHCIDVTARCHHRVSYDTDGWRGYVAPLMMIVTNTTMSVATTTSTATTTAQQQSSSQRRRGGADDAAGVGLTTISDAHHVVALAVCRCPGSRHRSRSRGAGAGGPNNHNTSNDSVLLACISRRSVVVWQDPHWYLSCRRPLTPPPTAASAAPSLPLQQVPTIWSSTSWNTAADGACQVVDITPDLVAVGTTTGVVIIYTMTHQVSTSINATNSGGTTMTTTATSAANNNNNKNANNLLLRPYVRIPAPPAAAAATAGVQVVAVKLHSDHFSSNQNKAYVVVAYRRRSTLSSSSTTNTTTTLLPTTAAGVVNSAAAPGVVVMGTTPSTSSNNKTNSTMAASGGVLSVGNNNNNSTAGLCCYDIPLATSTTSTTTLAAPLARHDLDGRQVGSATLLDAAIPFDGDNPTTTAVGGAGFQVVVARPDGLYSYSIHERIGVAPIDGSKSAICVIPPPIPAEVRRRHSNNNNNTPTAAAAAELDPVVGGGSAGAGGSIGTMMGGTIGYILVASTDAKSGRDVVDIYDASNKLVAFHLLLSPGHKAVRAAGITTLPRTAAATTSSAVAGSSSSTSTTVGMTGGQSSALVFTSGGSLVTLTEKSTAEKIDLLVQKNLYSAAIVVAYIDPSYEATDITALYRRYAEHLYRKGEYGAAMEQYMHTIGSLESSHVIFRYLDAPKIPLLVQYLERLRSRDLVSPVHRELLRTCYLKLNDTEAADAIAASAASRSINQASFLASILSSNLSGHHPHPREALATICTLDAAQVVDLLVKHGPSLSRALPREIAGLVMSLCVGTYSPKALADAALCDLGDLKSMVEYRGGPAATTTTVVTTTTPPSAGCEPYPVELFTSTFMEHPKQLRLVLAHCNRNKCSLSPALRRTLLDLTLAEWNQARRTGDTEAEKLRHKEAIAALTDSHCREIGDYDALVIVQQAGFGEGELLLYERLQMTPMLLQRYARDGSEKARRQMLAMCQTDPEVLADVLGIFVELASQKLRERKIDKSPDDISEESDEVDEIMEDIQELLSLALRQGVLPPVRIARILAGEGTGQFSTVVAFSASDHPTNDESVPVPLSVALDYVGTILEESRREIARLKAEVEEYNQLCNSMESEIDSLLRVSHSLPPLPTSEQHYSVRLNIDELYAKVRAYDVPTLLTPSSSSTNAAVTMDQLREAFWREMNQSEDRFETISRYFAKGVIG